MAYFPALELIASTSYWSNEYRYTVARTTGHGASIEPFPNGDVAGVGREK